MLSATPTEPLAELASTWTRALAALENRIGPSDVDNWFRSVRLLDLHGGHARLAVPTDLHEQRIRKRFLGTLCESLGVAECAFEIQPFNPERELLDAPDPETPRRPAPAVPAGEPPQEEGTPLNPEYCFDNYVVGPCNRFAHAAAVGVSDRPAAAFNPLFLHGPVGVGKTHLMQAIAHHLLGKEPDLKILFLSCETFVNHFIRSLQQGDVERFRNRYRQADVLVVDDIQMLANKARTQEEFFHTFNTLHNARKQIVLSSDSPPQDIPALQERLVSRFKWGLVAEIEPPCFETRVAILHAKAQRSGHALGDDVGKFLAEHIQSNVRELEGTLTRMFAMASLTNRAVDMALAREVLGPALRARQRIIRMDDILLAVVSRFGVKVSDLQSKRRTHSIVFPRQVAMYLARLMTSLSLEEIGGFFGGRDHSTVVYALERVSARRRVDSDFGVLLNELEGDIRGRELAA